MISLLVEVDVIGALDFSVAFRRDDDFGSGLYDPVGEMVGIVSLVGKGGGRLDAVDEIKGEGDVAALSGRTDKAEGKAERFGCRMDFGA